MLATATTQPDDDDLDHELDARITDLLHRLGAGDTNHPTAA